MQQLADESAQVFRRFVILQSKSYHERHLDRLKNDIVSGSQTVIQMIRETLQHIDDPYIEDCLTAAANTLISNPLTPDNLHARQSVIYFVYCSVDSAYIVFQSLAIQPVEGTA